MIFVWFYLNWGGFFSFSFAVFFFVCLFFDRAPLHVTFHSLLVDILELTGNCLVFWEK